VIVLAASGPSAYWYLTRGAGVVSLLLLSGSVVLGIVDVNRWRTERWPRFVIDGLHRNISLLALVMVVVHVLTTVADSFTPVGLKDAIIPFASPYRPLWLGLGALAFDLLLAVAVTSVFRRRLGHRAWRGVHWAAYACWPLALVHGLGTGTDTALPWMLALTAICVLAVGIAVGWRIGTASPDHPARRLGAGALGVGGLALVFWLASGPLGANWAARAGTPAPLLPSAPSTTPVAAATTPGLRAPFTARLSGSLRQRSGAASGLVENLPMSMAGGASGTLDVRIVGQPLQGGSMAMSKSSVSVGPPGQRTLYTGRILALRGPRILAVASSASGASIQLQIELSINQASGSVTGTVQAQPGTGGGRGRD
jgi:sulfoxide reductase heme-binding subunit YedZ